MKKQFVPYELALKLKELGFDEECFGVWFLFQNKPKIEYRLTSKNDKFKEGVFLAPTWQQAFDWFREKYNIKQYVYEILEGKWVFPICNKSISEYKISETYCNTYGEARLACLEKLIELVKR